MTIQVTEQVFVERIQVVFNPDGSPRAAMQERQRRLVDDAGNELGVQTFPAEDVKADALAQLLPHATLLEQNTMMARQLAKALEEAGTLQAENDAFKDHASSIMSNAERALDQARQRIAEAEDVKRLAEAAVMSADKETAGLRAMLDTVNGENERLTKMVDERDKSNRELAERLKAVQSQVRAIFEPEVNANNKLAAAQQPQQN